MTRNILFAGILLTVTPSLIKAQCIGCTSGGGGGAVSSVFSRTGTVTAVSGDYTQSQITPTSQQPAQYYCTTSSYSDPAYVCTTGASLSSVPLTGTTFVVTFGQACTDTVNNQITIDSLTTKTMLFGDGQALLPAICGTVGQSVILKLTNAGAGAFSLSITANSNSPICFTQAGGIYYNNSGALGCNSALFISGNALVVNHITGITNTAPTKTGGTGAGISPTITLGGTADDMSGTINITTGSSPATSAVIVTVTFGKTWSLAAPSCTITPANATTAALSSTSQVFVTTSTSNWVLNSNSAALSASTAYSWQYTCIQ